MLYHQFLLPDTRVLAWRWLEENVQSGAVIVREDKTPDLENVEMSFRTIRISSAFRDRTLLD